MTFRTLKAALLACGGIGALLAATADANAGGFALREQSAYGQGAAYAGVAAGGSLSSMFWNPATMTQFGGIQSEVTMSLILPNASNAASPTSPGFPLGGTGNTGEYALVPGSYFSYQLNPNLWLGMSVNAPFGLSVNFPGVWAGRDYAAGESHLRTYNATPSIAYRINDWISVGAGIQIQYGDAAFSHGISVLGLGEIANLSGTGWGYGFTAGVTVTPTPTTSIGLGYRSQVNQKIDGNLVSAPVVIPGSGAVSTTINLPDTVSLGIRQRIDPRFMVMATVEWTNWSRIGTSNIDGAGGTVATLPFQFKDGWFFSVGGEYQWSENLALRAGVGYEKSPVTDDVRMPVLPDNDRYWLSVGGSYQLTPKVRVDAAYSHVFVKDSSINITAASGNPWFNPLDPIAYSGDVSAHIDIFSIGLKIRFDNPEPPPVKTGFFKAR